jgi:hypothetical protein
MPVYDHLPFLTLNPFIFTRNKRRVISSEGIFALEKNAVLLKEANVTPRNRTLPGQESPMMN